MDTNVQLIRCHKLFRGGCAGENNGGMCLGWMQGNATRVKV